MDTCPNCESDDMGDFWVEGRKLQYRCRNCNWEDKPRIPEQKEIETKKNVLVNRFGGYYYEIYDKYGHGYVMSRSYSTRDEAVCEMHRDLECGNKREDMRPCTALLWPAIVEVEAEVIR